MEPYLVPWEYGEAELIEKRSRFIGRVWPVETEAQALEHIRAMREKHWDATHNVYAYIVRENNIARFSDDGEPSGTSGMPTLDVFRKEGIQNVCCVITRYFGGVLLGTGGLVRAYSQTAKLALDAAGVGQMAWWKRALVPCPYNRYDRVRSVLEQVGAVTDSVEYGADITIEALVPEHAADGFEKILLDATAGTVQCLMDGGEFRGVKLR